MTRRKTFDDYAALAKECGFRWLGPVVSSASYKTTWECEQGHRWEASFSSIQSGRGCPVCGIERRAKKQRKKPADYHALAKERGFRWLGPEVPNSKTKTSWECEQGHQWEAHLNSIRSGRGCPVCGIEKRAKKLRKTPADYQALARERGFRWLGPEVPNTLSKTTWECEQGHQWEAPYGSVQQGIGCPVCGIERRANKQRKTPADYHALAEERGFRWLGPKVQYTDAKTAWECEQGHQWEAPYSRIQQGFGCPYCSGRAPKTPADYHALAEERGFRWLGPEVPYTKTKTTWECEQGHQWEANFNSIYSGSGCPYCSGCAPKTPADYHALAEERGFRWLGPEVPNSKTKTTWECEQGHQWEQHFNSIYNGNGCPYCAGKATKTPADYHALAEERGFRWLGPEAIDNHSQTTWECEQGHQWEAPYNRIQQGIGCPYCSGKVPKTPADYHALAKERGFRWLGLEVPNSKTKTTWECEQGHQWEANFNNILTGYGCPLCVDIVQGARVSQIQRDLCEILDGELNLPVGRYNIDIALDIENVRIAVEYDAWYWHGHRQDQDAKRDKKLIGRGWRILRVKSNYLLPTQEQLDNAIVCLLSGQSQVEIILEDWGKGPTRSI